MALLSLLARWAGKAGGRVATATVDHGLRPESAAEARRVAEWSRLLGGAHRTLKVEAPPPNGGLQEWARERRYALLLQWARESGGIPVALAHTLDDQAETFLLNLARGSGVDGLAAMAPETMRGGVRLLRPLLAVSRKRLRRTLEALGQDWLEDPSNLDRRFLRVRARHAMEALRSLGIDARRLGATAAAMARARRALERQTAACLGDFHWGELGEVELDPARIGCEEREIGLRALRGVLAAASGRGLPPRLVRLESLLDWILGGGGARARTLHGCVLRRAAGGRILVVREFSRCAPALVLRAGEERVWDRRWRVSLRGGGPCLVGALGAEWRAGGALPRPLVRQSLPAFRQGGEIVAVPPLGACGEGVEGGAVLLRPGGRRAVADAPLARPLAADFPAEDEREP